LPEAEEGEKRMPTYPYHELLKQAQHLSADEQFQLLEDLLTTIRQRTVTKSFHSILELEGLGKEIWECIDVDQYLQQERNSWDG
jgi:hypothetical protein